MPKKKGGAIILGTRHLNLEDFEKVKTQLDKFGIKEGDLVATEISNKDLLFFRKLFDKTKSGEKPPAAKINEKNWKSYIKNPEDLAKAVINGQVSEGFRRKAQQLFKDTFEGHLALYLTEKKAEILPIESAHAKSMAANLLGKSEKSKTERKKQQYIVTPIRENYWRKKLSGRNPRFVIVGSNHLRAVKRMLPYEIAINLGYKEPIKTDIIRLKYQFIKAKRKARKTKARIKGRLRRK